MILSAILKLDAGAFTTPLGKAVEGIKGMLRISGDLSEKLGAAFDAGGALSDLASQTGEGAGSLMVLRQAFEDCGVGADALGQTLAIMRRSLGGISETGEPTGKIFKQLGLDINALQGLGAREQLAAIGAAVSGLKTPAEQSAAAMAVFGRSGSRMLTLLKDPEALGAAAESLGGLPALMDRNAAAFDAVSDRMGRIKEKSNGLWAGIAEGLLPLADQITGTLDGIDLTGLGQKIGEFTGATVQMFKDAPLQSTLTDLITVGLGEGVNYAATAFAQLGVALLDAMSGPLATLTAEFGMLIQGAMEKLSKLPGFMDKLPILKVSPILQGISLLGQADSLKGFKAQSFDEMQAQAKDDLAAKLDALKSVIPPLGSKIDLINNEDAKARLSNSYSAANATYQATLAALQAAVGPGKDGPGTAGLTATKSAGKEARIDTDSLARIGGYLGGGAVQSRIAALSERTARATERMAGYLASGLGRQRMVWGA